MSRVWVVGSCNVDRPWRVARHPQVGETVVGESLPSLPGGKGLNQAVAAVRMGASVALVGAVGNDADGGWLRGLAADEGIDVTNLVDSAAAPTGSALIVIDDHGANTVTVAPGANGTVTAEQVARLPIAAGDVVVAQLEVPVGAVAAAFDRAREVGARTVFNPSPIGADRTLVSAAHVVVVNQHEAADLAGHGGRHAITAADAVADAHQIRGDDQLVVVTLGGAGVVAVGPAGAVELDGIAVEVVDTTGAGDCFLGVLAASMAQGRSDADALGRANQAAALSVTRLGTVDAMARVGDLSAS